MHCKKSAVYHTVKKGYNFPVHSRDVNKQTLPGGELLNYSFLGRVWLVTSRLGTRKTITFFYSVVYSISYPNFLPCDNPRKLYTQTRRGIICKRPIQCLASSKLLTPPPHRPASVPLVRGEDTLAWWRGGGGSIVRKTPDTALYSIYVGTLCAESIQYCISYCTNSPFLAE